MKLFATLILFLFINLTYGQQRKTINIQINRVNSKYFDDKYKSVVDSAFIIANAVYNSTEFQLLFNSVNFPCWNRCIVEECAPSKNCGNGDSINGKTVLDSLFRETNVIMTIDLKRRSHSALGSTCPKTYYTTAFLENIRKDMPEIPLSYAIAANLCHEYMHQIGFCHLSNSFNQPDNDHPDPIGFKNDIAYRVGWQSYYILKRWYDKGIKINGL